MATSPPEEISNVSALLDEKTGLSTWTDEDMDEETGEEFFRDEDDVFPTTVDDFEEFCYSKNWEGNEADLSEESKQSTKSYAETARTFRLRRNVDQLDSLYKQKEQEVLKAREELKACRLQIAKLEMQRNKVEADIEQRKEDENAAAMFRLRAQHKRLCVELQAEEELESRITLSLTKHELEMCQVDLELGRVSHLQEEVRLEEQNLQAQKSQKASSRLQKEKAASQRTKLKTLKLERRKQKIQIKEHGARHHRALQEAEVCRQKASVHLKATMNRIRQEESAKESQSRDFIAKRMQAVMSLKSSLAAIQEKMRVQQAKDRANVSKQEEEERKWKDLLQAQGSNVTQVMFQNKQLKEFQKQKEAFEEKQKSKRAEIMSKLLLEEVLPVNRKNHNDFTVSTLTTLAPRPSKSCEKSVQYFEAASAETKVERLRSELRAPSPMSDEDGGISEDSFSTVKSTSVDFTGRDGSEVEGESLVQPEFTGLWDKMHDEFKDPQIDETKPSYSRKTGQEVLSQPPVKHQSGMVLKKTGNGKDFCGCPFICKPGLIHFKDFEVGKIYKKKVTLTNVTYSTNNCKLLGVSENLKDFISVHFEPPGPLSPGIAFDMLTTFKPIVNDDLDGEVMFLSASGQFSVPLKCTIKKCVLTVDSHDVDLGTHVVGQTISREITLTNQGALSTNFFLVPTASSDLPHLLSEPTSEVRQVPRDSICLESTLDRQKSSVPQESKTEGERSKSETEGGSHNLSAGTGFPVTDQEHSAPEQPFVGPASGVTSSELRGAELGFSEEDALVCNEICTGEVREGEIGPFGCVKLQILFTPTIPGEAKRDFHIKFSDPNSQKIHITVRGVAVSVPVWVVQPNIDLKICMYDHLYQDSISVQSRSSTALRLTFEVCKELRNHMEILPKTGYIQAHSGFQSQLKFLPRCSLPKDAARFFDSETGVLEVPMTVQVADQVRPIPFTVQAVITTSDLKFDRTEVDFGHCSIFESVKNSVQLTNLSLLPQEFGFLGIPKFVDIQPNDGFGTLLPQETLDIDIIFSAEKAGEYSFQLNCKSATNRDFKLSCQAIAVHPPLELSDSLVQFGATALGDKSTALLYVVNSHTSSNESTHPVPRIGKGAIAPVSPRLFEFAPPDCPEITITPTVGRVLPGQKCLVMVTFKPTLSDKAVKEEAVHLLRQAEELRVQNLETIDKDVRCGKGLDISSKKDAQVDPKKGKKKQAGVLSAKPAVKRKGNKGSPTSKSNSPFQPPNLADIQEGSDEYAAGKSSLLNSFQERLCRYIIPCFVSNGDTSDLKQVEYSPYNTLCLELRCPVVRPSMAVISNNGLKTLNFHQVTIGQKVVQGVTVKNISQKTLELKSSLLDLNGPFMQLNALRSLKPGATPTILLGFTPNQAKKYCETVEVRSTEMNLQLTIRGEGVDPTVTCTHEGRVMNFGYLLEKESATQVFKLQNTSSLPVQFSVYLESDASYTKHREQQGLPNFLTSSSWPGSTVGTQNYSGLSVFGVVPVAGAIAPGKTQDIRVTFHPDHESLHYSDRLTVELTNKTVCELELKGSARTHNMYVCGADALLVPVEYLAPLPTRDNLQFADSGETLQPLLLTLRSFYTDTAVSPAVREIEVGCINSTHPVAKKNVEFSWNNLLALQQRGFTVVPARGTVEPGNKRTIAVTWAPPSGLKPNETVHVSAQLVLKGDETEVYSVTLLAVVLKGPEQNQCVPTHGM